MYISFQANIIFRHINKDRAFWLPHSIVTTPKTRPTHRTMESELSCNKRRRKSRRRRHCYLLVFFGYNTMMSAITQDELPKDLFLLKLKRSKRFQVIFDFLPFDSNQEWTHFIDVFCLKCFKIVVFLLFSHTTTPSVGALWRYHPHGPNFTWSHGESV